MRVFTILVFIFCFYYSAAQTTDPNVKPTEQVVKKPARIKYHYLPRTSEFNSWDVGFTGGFTYPYTDISSSGKLNFGFSLDATKFLSHTFALQAKFTHAKLSGIDENNPDYIFNTTIDYDLSLNGIFQFNNISFLRHGPEIAPYIYLGIGMIHYSPEVSTDGGATTKNGIYSQNSQPFVDKEYNPTTDLVIPFGLGVKYRIGKTYSVSVEYSYRSTNSDKLDGFYKLLSSQDSYSIFGVGFIYHIGTKSKSLEWTNPMQTVYDELFELKDKFKQVTKDTDNDGVPDLWDREPETAPNTKVYGDGTSVDVDGDGFPDSNDAEPFSERNAKVDLFGRTIKKIEKPATPIDTSGRKLNENVTPVENNNQANNLLAEVKKENNNSPTNVPNSVTITDKSKEKTISSVVLDSTEYANYKDMPSLFFKSGEFKITSNHYKTLEYIAYVMMNNPGINFNIVGVCDNIGNMQFNITLGKRRAEAVKNYLENNFNINPVRLSVNTIGTYTASGSSQANRRVDIKERN